MMKRNFPKLLSLYLKSLPKHSIRTEHNESRPVKQNDEQAMQVRTRNHAPASVYHFPIINSSVPSPTVPEPEIDKLLESIRSSPSLKHLFEIVLSEERNLQENHLTAIFRSILQLQNMSKERYAPDALMNHLGFIKLCNQLRKVAPTMTDPGDLVVCLKTLTFCSVPPKSKIIQNLLQLIKARVNDLELQQIIFLNFLLKKLKSPLADALVIALPIVFQTQLEIQLDVDKLKQMCECLRYAVDHRLPAPKIKFISDKLLAYSNPWEAEQLCSVIWTLRHMRNLPENGILPLLENSLRLLAHQVDDCERKDLERTFVIIGENNTYKSRYWYNQHLFDKAAQRVVRERWSLNQTLPLSRTFSKVSHVNFEFLDYYGELIANSNKDFDLHPHYLLAPFADANYKPPSFERMMDVLQSFDSNKLEDSKNHLWFRFAIDCATLGVYPQDLLGVIFQESFIKSSFGEQPSNLDWLQLDLLHRSVLTEFSTYSGPFPSPSLTEKCHRNIFELEMKKMPLFPLEKALQTALGGAAYVSSGFLTRSGHFVDHVLALRPGGYPVAINTALYDPQEVRYVEDVNVTGGSQLILIKVLRSNAYVSNGERLRGVHDLDLRTLKHTGFNVVSIHLHRWELLQDYEKIPFLMQQIRLQENLMVS